MYENILLSRFYLLFSTSKLILDILPTIGTEEAAIALKMLIKKRVISGVAAAQAVNSLALVAVPTPAIIEILLVNAMTDYIFNCSPILFIF